MESSEISQHQSHIYDDLHDLVTFAQFKKHEKHSWRSVTFRRVAALIHGCFSVFFKLHKWYQIVQRISCKQVFARNSYIMHLKIMKHLFRFKKKLNWDYLFLERWKYHFHFTRRSPESFSEA